MRFLEGRPRSGPEFAGLNADCIVDRIVEPLLAS